MNTNLSTMRKIATELVRLTRDSFSLAQNHFRLITSRADECCIYFLGTGQGTHNISSRGMAKLKASRLVSGPIISTSKSAIWIDPGPDCLEALSKINFDPRWVDAIFLSHAHTDHISNVSAAIEMITCATENKKNKSLYGNLTSINGDNSSPRVISRYHSDYILKECRALDVGDAVDLHSIKIKAIPCHHKETPQSDKALNWKISINANNRKYSLSHIDGNILVPDSNGEPSTVIYEDVIKGIGKCDLLIVNVSNHVKMPLSKQNYPSTKGLLELLRIVQPKLAFTTHFGIEMMNPCDSELQLLRNIGLKDLIEFQAAYVGCELQNNKINTLVIPAYDGMKVLLTKNIIQFTDITGIRSEVMLD